MPACQNQGSRNRIVALQDRLEQGGKIVPDGSPLIERQVDVPETLNPERLWHQEDAMVAKTARGISSSFSSEGVREFYRGELHATIF